MQENEKSIAAHPAYEQIRANRTRLAWPLTTIMLVAYYGFIMAIAFSPARLGHRIGSSEISIGIVLGFGLILLSFALTGLYSYLANRRIEPLIRQLKEEVGQDG